MNTKIYLYDKDKTDYKGEEFSQYLLQGDVYTDPLDDTLSTYNCTLENTTIKDCFKPETRFIIEKYQDETGQKQVIHMQVQSDTVSKDILSVDLFTHHLSLIEPSVTAQKRIVDDISISYKLKDVTLYGKTESDYATITHNEVKSDELQLPPVKNIYNDPTYLLYKRPAVTPIVMPGTIAHTFEWFFPTYYGEKFSRENGSNIWKNLLQRINDIIKPDGTHVATTIDVPIPMLLCRHAMQKDKGDTVDKFGITGICSVVATVTDKDLKTGKIVTKSFKCPNSCKEKDTEFGISEWDWLPENVINANGTGIENFKFNHGWIPSRPMYVRGSKMTTVSYNTTKVAGLSIAFPFSLEDRIIKFTSDTSVYDPKKRHILLQVGHSYDIRVQLLTFDTDKNQSGLVESDRFPNETGKRTNFYDKYPCYYASTYISVLDYGEKDPTILAKPNFKYLDENTPYYGTSFEFIEDKGVAFVRSAPPVNAYDLLMKAIYCSDSFNLNTTDNGLYSVKTPFYVDEDVVSKLQSIKVKESFFQQKNLWQVLMEIGKYIHGKPSLSFGSDDRYNIKWKLYGNTEISNIDNQVLSVFSSQFVEEYISSVASYTENLVQIGGEVEEIIHAKSSSNEYLVYNDVAEIITRYPIMEIIKLEIARNNDLTDFRDITNNIFEENIYNILLVTDEPDLRKTVNKGNAIYYKLGSNKIVGLNYRLPSISPGQQHYAIKNIIGLAFDIDDVSQIMVNDYAFRIRYRTKDRVRTTITRPDLRKYILSSKFDRYPKHEQFRNQNAILVDSEQLGINIYGELIRTGNKTFERTEFTPYLNEVRKSGDLVLINNERYYVSKVTSTYYTSEIVSKVEYSQDWNRLAQIIGIDSEPRFYEIAERGVINREKSINDFILIQEGGYYVEDEISNYMTSQNSFNFIADKIFRPNTKSPKYAITAFKDYGSNDNLDGKVVCTPVNNYFVGTTYTIEWDMKDNFSAGEQVVNVKEMPSDIDKAYKEIIPYRYADVYGRADLIDFSIVYDLIFKNNSVISNLPEAPIEYQNTVEPSRYKPIFTSTKYAIGNKKHGIILLKDSRETIHINYNLQVLTSSDRFVVSSKFWQTKNYPCKVVLLKDEINKFSIDSIPTNSILGSPYPLDLLVFNEYISLSLSNLPKEEIKKSKAVAIVECNDIDENGNAFINETKSANFVFGRNIVGEEFNQWWTIRIPPKNTFKE